MRRFALVAAVAVGVLAVPAPAWAHGDDTPESTAYRTRVSGVSPAERGLRVRAVEAGARLELTNDTGHSVEVLGYSGEPYLDVRPDGTYQNDRSPAAYVNRTLDGDTPVPATADPTAPPSWRRVSTGTTVRWHDRRTHWLTAGLPPAATADPSRTHRLRDWTVPLREQARTFEIRGTLDWVPPPRAWLWWAGAALFALVVVLVGGRWVALIGLVAATTYLSYAVLRALDARVFAPLPVVVALLAAAPMVRRGPFLLALGGLVLAVFGGLADLGVFSAAVVPVTGPAWFARPAVLLALGAGTAMAVTGVRRVRALSPPGAKVGA